MLVIPIKPIENQSLGVILAGQSCTINIYTKGQFEYAGLYLDLYVSDALVIGGVICHNRVRIVRSPYLGFVGDLVFYDTNTRTPADPLYTGLGGRWFLAYLSVLELIDAT